MFGCLMSNWSHLSPDENGDQQERWNLYWDFSVCIVILYMFLYSANYHFVLILKWQNCWETSINRYSIIISLFLYRKLHDPCVCIFTVLFQCLENHQCSVCGQRSNCCAWPSELCGQFYWLVPLFWLSHFTSSSSSPSTFGVHSMHFPLTTHSFFFYKDNPCIIDLLSITQGSLVSVTPLPALYPTQFQKKICTSVPHPYEYRLREVWVSCVMQTGNYTLIHNQDKFSDVHENCLLFSLCLRYSEYECLSLLCNEMDFTVQCYLPCPPPEHFFPRGSSQKTCI